MSVEQVARDFVSNMADEAKIKSMMAMGAMASGGVLPEPMPLERAVNMMAGLMQGFPDIQFDVQQVTVDGDRATVDVQASGTNTGTLTPPMPGAPSIPPTGKQVSVPDRFVITVHNDKVTLFQVDSPAGGGIPGMLAQLGVPMPKM